FGPLEEYACETLCLDEESTKVVRDIAGTEFFTHSGCSMTGNDKVTEQLACLWTQDEESLVDFVAKTVGASASILKKSFVGDRRIELIATCLNTHPLEVIAQIRQSSSLSVRDYKRTAERVLSVAVGAILGRLDWRLLRSPVMHALPDLFSPMP